MALSPRATGATRATSSRDYVHPRWFARVVWILSSSRLGPSGSPPEFCQAYNIGFLFLSIRLTLSPFSLRYRLDFIEIFCQVLYFFVIVVLRIVISLGLLLFLV